MSANIQQIKTYLKGFNFSTMFREEIGWNRPRDPQLTIPSRGQEHTFVQLAEKANFKVYSYTFPTRIPEERVLRQIDALLDDHAAAHLTIFMDALHENQAWLWIKREMNKPAVARLNRLNKLQSGDLLAQKINSLFVGLKEEEQGNLTLIDILTRVMQGFDVEKITKTFYEGFKTQHATFLTHIKNINDEDDCEWYTSIMLNRLMFIYFIQRKGLLGNPSKTQLDGRKDYLRERLQLIKAQRGPNNFYTFYRYFLRRLFHEGLNQPEADHSPELEQVIGIVPYVNGGLFDIHLLEQRYPDIQIDDDAFEQLFDFFKDFDWHLDDRPSRTGNEINPDVLGYIFEKYINQKQMGAYYTKEDITDYISKNTVIPFIFEKTAQHYPAAFAPDGPIWSLLRTQPADYFYEAMTHGLLEPLPPEIAAGLTTIAQRATWNQAASEQWALPTETWREVVARRQRYTEVRELLVAGKVTSINDLITYNLNITQFAVDVIVSCQEPALLHEFYTTIEQVTVLDPTCGSGAFLFASLNTLQPLYQACLKRMATLIASYEECQIKLPAAQRTTNSDIEAFSALHKRSDQHRSKDYFILKSIIINNLYGVDIMEEAVEICKLRLFLKLVAQIEQPADLEPLPDIDFNVLAGNTLIGFTSLDEIRKVVTEKVVAIGGTEEALARIEQQAKEIEHAEQSFRSKQTELHTKANFATTSEEKRQLRAKLEAMRTELDKYLATEYGIDNDNIPDEKKYQEKYTEWNKKHKPFHWLIEVYKIIQKGGFDIVIGNPPYVEYRTVRTIYKILATEQYTSLSANNLYAFCMERSTRLLDSHGRFGMIVPAGLLGLDEAIDLRKALLNHFGTNWFSTFAIRPSKLFEGVDQRLCIHIASAQHASAPIYTTTYHHWHAEERPALFALLDYQISDIYPVLNRIPQVGSREIADVIAKLREMQLTPLRKYYALPNSGFLMHYHRSPRYWIRGMDFEQYFKSETRNRSIHHFRNIYFKTEIEGKSIGAILNSSLFFVWFITIGNGRNITGADVEQFPIGHFSESVCKNLVVLFDTLMDDYKHNSVIRVRQDCEFQEFRPSRSKPIIDQIDRVLAQHYGFTDEELDFIINYDIKYRMGRDSGEESEE